jgi:hypothetical protein
MLAGEPDIRWVPAYTLLVHRTRRLLCLRPSNESTVDPLHDVAFQEGRRILIAHTPIPLTSWSTARAPTVALECAGVRWSVPESGTSLSQALAQWTYRS